METNLFIKSAKVDNNKISDINFYGDWEIDLGSGSGSGEGGEIQVGNGKPFIVDTQDTLVSIRTVKASSFSIKIMYRKLNAGNKYYRIACTKYKDNNTYTTQADSIYIDSSYDIKVVRHKPADIDNFIIMFFSETGDYIKGYKFTGKYLQSLM